jgi:hypothetical protein
MAKKYDKYGNLGTGASYVYDVDPTKTQGLQGVTPQLYGDTANNKTGYYDAGLAAMANDQTSKWYTGGNQYDASYVYDQIQREKENYAKAQQLGDTAAMDAAHKRAEAWRATAGYSGGESGADYIKLGGAGTGTMGTTRVTDSQTLQNLARQNGDAEGYYVNYYTPEVAAVSADELAQQNPYFTSLKGTAQGTNAGYDDLAREMYINYTKTQDGIGEQMGMAGLGGSGLTETSRVGLGNQYQENLYQNEAARVQAQNALRTQIATYLSQGAITQEQADALLAGLGGGDYTVQGEGIPGQTGGWSSVFVPYTESGDGTNTLTDIGALTEAYRQAAAAQYANPQQRVYEDTTITPTLDDASMYYLLKSTGMNDDLINAYYKPGQPMPTPEQVLAEREAAMQPKMGVGVKKVDTTPVYDPSGSLVEPGSYTIGGVAAADPTAASYTIIAELAKRYGYDTPNFDKDGFEQAIGSEIRYGRVSPEKFRNWLNM